MPLNVIKIIIKPFSPLSVHQPLLKALDRTDILEAPNRFENRQKETAPPPAEVGPSSADYDGLSTMQRKAKKAQKFGVKVGAMLGGADALQLALKRKNSPGNSHSRPPSDTETSSRPPSEILRPPSETEGSRPPSVFEPTMEGDMSRPPPPKYPPPHSKRAPPPPPSSSGDGSPYSGSPASSVSSSPAHSYPAAQADSMAIHTGNPPNKKRLPPRIATKPPTSPRRNRRPLNSPQSARPINVSVFPNHGPLSATSSSSSTTSSSAAVSRTHVQYSPVPKPHRNLRHLSAGSAGDDAHSSPTATAASPDIQRRRLSESILLSSSEIMMSTPMEDTPPRGKRPLSEVKSLTTDKDRSSSKREEMLVPISNLDTVPHPRVPRSKNMTSSSPRSAKGQENPRENYSTNTAQRRALLANSNECESTLDFTSTTTGTSSGGKRSKSHTRYISNSVPDLLEDPPNPTSPRPLLLAAPPNGSGAGRAKGLAASSDVLFNGTPMDHHVVGVGEGGSGLTSRSTSQYSDMSAVSGGSGVDTPPPQVRDSLSKKHKFGSLLVSQFQERAETIICMVEQGISMLNKTSWAVTISMMDRADFKVIINNGTYMGNVSRAHAVAPLESPYHRLNRGLKKVVASIFFHFSSPQ